MAFQSNPALAQANIAWLAINFIAVDWQPNRGVSDDFKHLLQVGQVFFIVTHVFGGRV